MVALLVQYDRKHPFEILIFNGVIKQSYFVIFIGLKKISHEKDFVFPVYTQRHSPGHGPGLFP